MGRQIRLLLCPLCGRLEVLLLCSSRNRRDRFRHWCSRLPQEKDGNCMRWWLFLLCGHLALVSRDVTLLGVSRRRCCILFLWNKSSLSSHSPKSNASHWYRAAISLLEQLGQIAHSRHLMNKSCLKQHHTRLNWEWHSSKLLRFHSLSRKFDQGYCLHMLFGAFCQSWTLLPLTLWFPPKRCFQSITGIFLW